VNKNNGIARKIKKQKNEKKNHNRKIEKGDENNLNRKDE
jgi:hypothetical protein